MKNRYLDLIEQTFDFPQEEFKLDEKGSLLFHDIPLERIIEEYGTPLKLTYLPRIDQSIAQCHLWFKKAMEKHNYKADYNYCYCTKSNHFEFVINRTLSSGAHLETSSAFDLNIIESFAQKGKIDQNLYIICNGFKTDDYLDGIANLINQGFHRCYPIIDNFREIHHLQNHIQKEFDYGIRIASEEDPKSEFYTSRLGIGYKDILPYYKMHLKSHQNGRLRMLHFFINTGISDTSYYWSELRKCLKVYVQLKKECPSLDSLNIGGGFPIRRSLNFQFDYQYMVDEIIGQIQSICNAEEVEVPHIFTEFGSYTVGEASANIFRVLHQKQQNDREKWNMIDGSFMTTLPDSWAISHRFVLLPVNNWKERYERVLLGGLTCDSDDYYNSEQHVNAIYVPEFDENRKQDIGFFNTGAYQESLSGYGGIKHCLIPAAKHIVIDREDGELNIRLFRPEQTAKEMMDILGY